MSGISHKQCHHIYDEDPSGWPDSQSEPSTEPDQQSTEGISSSETEPSTSSDDTSTVSEEDSGKGDTGIATTAPDDGNPWRPGLTADDTDTAETIEVHSAHLPLFELEPGHTYTAHPWQHPTFRCDQAFHRRK